MKAGVVAPPMLSVGSPKGGGGGGGGGGGHAAAPPPAKLHKKGGGMGAVNLNALGGAGGHHPGTPLGKGRKLCQGCNGVVGSPTRICPHCQATLPFKQNAAASPKPPATAAGGGGNAGAAAAGAKSHKKGAGAAAAAAAAAAASKAAAAAAAAAAAEDSGGGGGVGAVVSPSTTIAQFLSRHQEKMQSCKVNQLKRSVGDLCAGIKAVIDAGRVSEAVPVKHLRDMSKKVSDVRLLQGVVERPRARRDVIALIEAAVKMCNKYGL